VLSVCEQMCLSLYVCLCAHAELSVCLYVYQCLRFTVIRGKGFLLAVYVFKPGNQVLA